MNPEGSASGPAHPGSPYFEQVGNLLGREYLRYNFTKGTDNEVEFIVDLLGLEPGMRLLDVGCGPGRHAVAFAARGLQVVGIDVSRRFLDLAAEKAREEGVGAAFFECDARQMPFDNEFDVVVSICQGAFGLMGLDDSLVLRRMMEAAKPGAFVALTAFSALYEAHHQREEATFDADLGIVHESTTVKDEDGNDHQVDLWTTVYTPRELRLLSMGVGLVPESVYSVEPGSFVKRKPSLDHPEYLLVARKPE